jgi:hypothetical protein
MGTFSRAIHMGRPFMRNSIEDIDLQYLVVLYSHVHSERNDTGFRDREQTSPVGTRSQDFLFVKLFLLNRYFPVY